MHITVGSVDWAVITSLDKCGKLNRGELIGVAQEELKNIGDHASQRAVEKRLKKLKEDGIIETERVGRFSVYEITSNAEYEFHGMDLRSSIMGSRQETNDSVVKYLKRERHSDDLKVIIRQWVEEIPIVTSMVIEESSLAYGIQDISEYIKENELWLPSKFPLPIEKDPLFEDLINHRGFEGVLEIWDDFKESCNALNDMKKSLFSTVSTDLNSEFCAIEQIKLGIDANIKTKNLSSPSLAEWTYDGAILFADKKIMTFNKWYNNFKSSSFDADGFIVYKIGSREHFRIAKNLVNEFEFKEDMDKALKNIIQKIKSNYYSEACRIIKLIKETNEKKEELTYLLKKKLSYVVFEGDCEYL